MQHMLTNNEDVFYYITVTNENQEQPSMPSGAEDGHDCLQPRQNADVRLLASGPILKEALDAAHPLSEMHLLRT